MINLNEVFETNKMIHEMNLDVRTITIGISLLDCVGATLEEVKENIYNKITTVAKDIVKTILDKQTTDVDTISGATYSSTGIKNAVGQALEGAAK